MRLSLILVMYISTASSQGCTTKPIDFVLLLDESGSVGKRNFILQREFVANFVEGFSIGNNLLRVAVVTFAIDVKIEFYLNTYLSKTEIIEKIRQINYSHPGLTMTQRALKSARTEILNVNNGMRSTALHIVIVMTDGKSMLRSATISEAKQLHNMDVIVFAIGISKEIDKEELREIASNPDNVITVKDFHTLRSIQDNVENTACKAILRKEKATNLTQIAEKMSMATSVMRTATPTPASGNIDHTVVTTRIPISTTRRPTSQKSTIKTTKKPASHSITAESSNWWMLHNAATTKPWIQNSTTVSKWITSKRTTFNGNTVIKIFTSHFTYPIKKTHPFVAIIKRTSIKGANSTTTPASAFAVPTITTAMPIPETSFYPPFLKSKSSITPMTTTKSSVPITTKRQTIITKPNTTTTQTIDIKNIEIENKSGRKIALPVWFKLIEIGVIAITVILGLGVLGCCCLQLCGGKRTEDEEEERESITLWKYRYRSPVLKPGNWTNSRPF